MKLKLMAMLNKDVPLSNVLNGLSHMTFGMGHRIKGVPSLSIYFGDTAQVRAFRTLSSKLNTMSLKTTVFSDFPHTMVGRSTEELIAKVTETPESEVIYYGSCFMATDIDPQLIELTQSCSQLMGYEPSSSDEQCFLSLPEKNIQDTKIDNTPMKISLMLNSKVTLAQNINNIVLASLNVGLRVPVNKQYLLNVRGPREFSYGLTNISFHSLTVVTTGKPYNSMRENAEHHPKLVCAANDLLTMVFGTKADVESVILQKSTRLFSEKLKEGDLVVLSQPNIVSSPLARRRDSYGNTSAAFFAEDTVIAHKNETRSSSEEKKNSDLAESSLFKGDFK